MDQSDCMGAFRTPDLSTFRDKLRAANCAHSDTDPESIGSAEESLAFASGVGFVGAHTVRSGSNTLLNVNDEFVLNYHIVDTSGPITVPSPSPARLPPPSPSPAGTPQPTTSRDPNSPLILSGSTGPNVRELQQDLIKLGYDVG